MVKVIAMSCLKCFILVTCPFLVGGRGKGGGGNGGGNSWRGGETMCAFSILCNGVTEGEPGSFIY